MDQLLVDAVRVVECEIDDLSELVQDISTVGVLGNGQVGVGEPFVEHGARVHRELDLVVDPEGLVEAVHLLVPQDLQPARRSDDVAR